jgi:peptide/nickel transport system substrate-binding protein
LTNPDIKLEQTNEFRTLFFGFDMQSDDLKYGDAGGKNPFKDTKVRQAINMAIDADAIAKTVMRGYATPTGQILAPGNTGYDSALDGRASYDPEAAKALLAEAGYPDGFSITLDCPNNRYINDEQICRAVTAMLTQIGLDVSLNAMPRATYFPKLFERDTSMFMMGFNSPYFDGMYALETLLMTRNDETGEGIYNYENFSNPDLDTRIAAARDETDLAERAEMMKAIYKTITEEVVLVPLHHQVLVYAMRDNVDTPVRPDNWLEIRWVTMD